MNSEFKIKRYPFEWKNLRCCLSFHNTCLPNFTWKGWHLQILNFSIWRGKYLTQRDDLILPPNEREELKKEIESLKKSNEVLLEQIKNKDRAENPPFYLSSIFSPKIQIHREMVWKAGGQRSVEGLEK